MCAHTLGNKHQCVCVCATVYISPYTVPKEVSKHVYSSPQVEMGGWPQLGSHTFSRTNDFHLNDNELMTHGGLWALEGSQRRTTRETGEVGQVWGLKDLVSQKAHSSSVQILETEGLETKEAQDMLETSIFPVWPACLFLNPAFFHSLLCAQAQSLSLSLSHLPKALTLAMEL